MAKAKKISVVFDIVEVQHDGWSENVCQENEESIIHRIAQEYGFDARLIELDRCEDGSVNAFFIGGLTGTVTFFVNGNKYTGTLPPCDSPSLVMAVL